VRALSNSPKGERRVKRPTLSCEYLPRNGENHAGCELEKVSVKVSVKVKISVKVRVKVIKRN
jgi:hypothetical protein